MRCSSKSLIKIISVSIVVSLSYLSYAFYSTPENPLTKSPSKRVRNSDEVKRKSYAGVKLFRNVENSFEDMYSFKLDLTRFRSGNGKLRKNRHYPNREIEIWGKASIGEYLWSHVLQGNWTNYANGLIRHGEMKIDNLLFRFRSGPGIVQNTVPSRVKNLILILNGKDEVKIRFSKAWLDYLTHFKSLKNVALVLLGDEKCENNWILQYMKTRGGIVDFVFLVYDSKLIDNREFYQWPLGVATYRGFPRMSQSNQMSAEAERRHVCSFLGTIYKNSSREMLSDILKKSGKCFVSARNNWIPVETYESMSRYVRELGESDLALNPVGKNTECYRIYEALSLGAVPVVENVVTPGDCDRAGKAPLRLLKEQGAPLIYVKDWNSLNRVLEAERELSPEKKIDRRKRIVKWYEEFKLKMKNRFVEVIKKNFFKEE